MKRKLPLILLAFFGLVITLQVFMIIKTSNDKDVAAQIEARKLMEILGQQPSPDFSPDQVVKIVTSALQHNDEPTPNSGIAVAFRFASPANKELTGPLDRFIQMVRSPAYWPLLESTEIRYGKPEIEGDHAEMLIEITGKDDQPYYFLFRLTRQTAEALKGCWMTDGVVPVEPAELELRKNGKGKAVL